MGTDPILKNVILENPMLQDHANAFGLDLNIDEVGQDVLEVDLEQGGLSHKQTKSCFSILRILWNCLFIVFQ